MIIKYEILFYRKDCIIKINEHNRIYEDIKLDKFTKEVDRVNSQINDFVPLDKAEKLQDRKERKNNQINKEGVVFNKATEKFNKEVDYISRQIIKKYAPEVIILFGSVAKGIFKANSDIDLCIIKNTNDKRKLLADMYVCIDCRIPFDLVLYTTDEWNKFVNDKNSFAYTINNTGVKIYG